MCNLKRAVHFNRPMSDNFFRSLHGEDKNEMQLDVDDSYWTYRERLHQQVSKQISSWLGILMAFS